MDSRPCRLSERIGKGETVAGSNNAEYPAYAKECIDPVTDGSSDLLTGQKLTPEQIAALEAKKKERDVRCKPEADRLAQIQKEIIAAQQ